MVSNVLILPGLFNSGPEHWQSVWEQSNLEFKRVEQRDWDHPRRDDWIGALEAAVETAGPDTVLVSHSLACSLVAFWAAETRLRVRGALLVAPCDTEAPSFLCGTEGFIPMPRSELPFHSIVVASTDDPYATIERAREFATWWGSEFVEVGALGHIDSASGIGAWPQGWAMLTHLRSVSPGELPN